MAPGDQAYAYGDQAYAYPYPSAFASARELQGIRGDRGYEDTYLVFDRQNNIGELGGAGTFGLAHDPGDEIVEIVLTLTLAQNPTETMQRVQAGIDAIGDDPTALAAAQAALVVPAPVDPSSIAHNDLATRDADDAHPHEAIAFTVTAATTLGTVVGKIEVFDSAGASLGFLPVYDAIT